MPKGKRKQNKQHGEDGDDDDSCKHINKLPANHLEKMLENKTLKGCEDCQSGRKKGKPHGGKPPRADDLWICLTCGAVTCGNSTPQFHCRQHYAYYNKHFVIANIKTLEVKCFECALNIKVDDSDKHKDLRQCLNVIKKAKGLEVDDEPEGDAKENRTENESHEDHRGKNNKQNQKNQGKKGKQQQQQSRKGRQGLNEDIELVLANEVAHLDISNDMTSGIKGLKNLGNTCFFNSIMQNLAHTIPLREKIFQLMGPIREEMKTSEKPIQNNDNTKKEEKSTSESETTSTSSESMSNNNTNEESKATSNDNSTAPLETEQKEATSEPKNEVKSDEEKKENNETTKANANNNNATTQPLEGPLTKSFKDFMVNMWHGKGSVFSPQSLFLQIKKKAPRFSTMRQQDAQELLRYLLDGLSSEERIVFQVEAAKREMANFPSLDKLTKEQQLELKSILAKVKAKPPPSLIEQLFEGQLESTITCHHCGHKSRVIEPILDLSLSLESPSKKGAAVQQEEFKLNKKQRQKLLREKQIKEKQAEELKKQQEEQKKAQEEAQNNPNPESSTTEEAPKVDAEAKPEDISSQPEANATTVDTKAEEAPKDQAEGASKSDTTAEQQQVSENATSESAASAEKKEESHATPTEPKDTETKTALVEAKEQTKGKSETNAKKTQQKGKNNNGKAEPKNDWDDLPEDTVPPMMSQVDGRHVKEVPTGCSVQSTLYAFTAPEMLDSDNAFSCYNCTKLHWMKYNKDLTPLILAHGDPPEIEEIKKKLEHVEEKKEEEAKVEQSGEKEESTADGSDVQSNPDDALATDSENKDDDKMDTDEEDKEESKPQKEAKPAPKPKIPLLRRTATKQFLFKKQPDILTLHIKRFMQTNNGFQKISTHVEYPAILDLTPYLSETCTEQEKKYKYKLYGIVSHSGGLNSGHYVAYVRNRRVNETLEDAINAGWHYFSDTQFHELRFEEVLRKEAYMLFYERFEDSSAEDKSSDL